MMHIQEKMPFKNYFEWLGGETRIRELVDRFYDLMDAVPDFAALRATHGANLDRARQHMFWFLCGWTGGPSYYAERFGHPNLRQRHARIVIGQRERDQWVSCMKRTMQEIGLPEALQVQLATKFSQTADFIRHAPAPSPES